MGIRKSNQIIAGKKYRFTLLTPQLIRMEYSDAEYFTDEKTQVVVNRDFPEFDYQYVETDSKLEIITDFYHMEYDKKAFSSNGLKVTMKSNFTDYDNEWFYGKKIETLKGTARTLDQIDGEVVLEEGIISKQGYGLLDDSESFILDDQNRPKNKEQKSIDIYLFCYQRDYKLAIQDYFKLTGPTPVIPRFALGNWWSRFWAYTSDSYLALMEKFEENEVPLSVSILDMDWHKRDVPMRFGSGWTGYSWNKDLIPNPPELLSILHDRGLKVSLNVHPADGIRAFEDAYPQIAERLKLNVSLEEPASFDLTNEAFLEGYFKDVHHPLEEQGVDFWWIDWQQGNKSLVAGLDPLWLLNHYHFNDLKNRDKEPLILSRYAGPGSHRYPIGFSGDTIISWDSLKFQPYFTSTASNIGYTWWSHDIGGHMGGVKDSELILRWFQLGVYSPINRLHSSASLFNSKEPWEFEEPVSTYMMESLRERHRLIPYLFTQNVKTSEEGTPLCQPMYYEHPNDIQAYDYRNQYYFGSELIVVPMVSKSNLSFGYSSEKAWLPKGSWYDFNSGIRYEGDAEIEIFRRIDEQGVFAKSGAIIPTDPNIMKTKQDNLPSTIEWKIFPGADNEYELIEEVHGKRCISKLIFNWTEKSITIEVEGDKSILPLNRTHQISLHNVKGIDGASFVDNKFQIEIKDYLLLNVKEIEKQDISKLLYERIKLPEISYNLKNKLWDELLLLNDIKKKVSFIEKHDNHYLSRLLFEVFYIEES